MSMNDLLEVSALLPSDVRVDDVLSALTEAAGADGHVSVMTPVPLSDRASARFGCLPLYLITIAAGLVGIGVGVFFAGGTAAMYPLMTGGKAIVAVPVVAIVSYETMMLLAIVTTFVSTILSIRRSHRTVGERNPRVDDGYIGLSIIVGSDVSRISAVRTILQQAGASDIRLSSQRPVSQGEKTPDWRPALVVAATCITAATAACSRDMEEQPSYRSQEAPLLSSPVGSVPRDSRAFVGARSSTDSLSQGARLFRINCSHCHGAAGLGDGPAAGYLKEKPSDLRSPEVQSMAEAVLYQVVTHGKDVMPPFKGELSAEERRSVVAYIKSWPDSKRAAE